MWQDLMKPVEPVAHRFAKGKTNILDNGCLTVKIEGVESSRIHMAIGYSPTLCISKESAKRLSEMFRAIYNQLEE